MPWQMNSIFPIVFIVYVTFQKNWKTECMSPYLTSVIKLEKMNKGYKLTISVSWLVLDFRPL